MIATSLRLSLKSARTAAILSAFFLTACSSQTSEPQRMESSNPTISYKYRGDQELLQANQNAMTYCSQYRSVARTVNIADTADNTRTVFFECIPTESAAPPPQTFTPNYPYSYRTDQDLLDASQNAETYCRNSGSQRAVSTIITNQDGSRALSFRCVPQ